jgi:hypothetical protein
VQTVPDGLRCAQPGDPLAHATAARQGDGDDELVRTRGIGDAERHGVVVRAHGESILVRQWNIKRVAGRRGDVLLLTRDAREPTLP